jgi:hypothetical protein
VTRHTLVCGRVAGRRCCCSRWWCAAARLSAPVRRRWLHRRTHHLRCKVKCAVVFDSFYERCSNNLGLQIPADQMQQYTGLFHTCSTQLPIEPLLTTLIACHVAPPSPSIHPRTAIGAHIFCRLWRLHSCSRKLRSGELTASCSCVANPCARAELFNTSLRL